MRRLLRNTPILCSCPCPIRKRILITGATSGIGLAAADILCNKNHSLILACRNVEEGNRVKEKLFRKYSNADIDVYHLDLENYSSIKKFVAELPKDKPINVLLNNAGVLSATREFNVAEISHGRLDRSMAINYIGTALLTKQLLNRLLADMPTFSCTPRVVFVSSSVAATGNPEVAASVNCQVADWSPMKSYANSKLALNLYAQQLAQCYNGQIDVFTVITGGMVNTNLNREVISNFPLILRRLISWLSTLILLSPVEGCQSAIHCTVSQDVVGAHCGSTSMTSGSGLLYRNCRPVNWPDNSRGLARRKELWSETEAILSRL